MNTLTQRKCWVLFRFPDGSVTYIFTTLNSELLEGIGTKANSMFDFNKMKWFNLNLVKTASAEVYLDLPTLREVDVFANQFICS